MSLILQNALERLSLLWATFLPIFWHVVAAAAVLIVGLWFAYQANKRLNRYLRQLPHVDETSAIFLSRALYALILVVTVLIALTQLGVETTSLIALLGGAALAVALALQSTLGNLAAGLQLLILRPLAKDSVVEAAGITGTVDEISLFTTTLQTFNGERIVVPNSSLTGSNIFNYNKLPVRRVRAVVSVGYGEDVRRVRDILLDLAEGHPLVLEDPAPDVWVVALADSGVDLSLRVWVRRDDFVPVLREILLLVKERLDAEGVEIPFPQRVIHRAAEGDSASVSGGGVTVAKIREDDLEGGEE
ncbi:MAG: mechanosensitive ion channel family protein [Alphaproteobacteria bacterium]|nr:mechanosensitive ion channel family protein [Alphaproteobacteria bacterium]MDA8000918.1 mechanosensitive ion channel family protein [Alphaproteobacteria bacterium]MDA8000926.1 mechanosensitive ion channel family protein [Alphaproteobacteria bacterium]MDA8004788.1 mechanosensitive ion channel family protein [Alphaproteobacteria bacterium]MDA8005663.1 mechanosensitive ion channel family protein [Alphaproteobacteria bacterium]